MECDIDNIANEFTDRVKETIDIHNQIGCRENFRPEQFKVAFLQNVSQFDDIADGWIFHLNRQQEAFAQREIGVWQIGECFEQDKVCDFQIHEGWIELV